MILRMKDKLIIVIVVLFFVLMIQQYKKREGFTSVKSLKNSILAAATNGELTVDILSKNNTIPIWKEGEIITEESINEWHKLFTEKTNDDVRCSNRIGQDFCNSNKNPKYMNDKTCSGPSCGKCAPLIGNLSEEENRTELNYALCEAKNMPVFAKNFKDIYRIYLYIKNALSIVKNDHELSKHDGKFIHSSYIFGERASMKLAFIRAFLYYYTFGVKNVDTTMQLSIQIKVYIHLMANVFYHIEIEKNKKAHKLPLQQLAFIKMWNIMHNIKFTKKILDEIYSYKTILTKTFIYSLEKQVKGYMDNGADNNNKEYYHIDKYIKDDASKMSINGILQSLRLR
jgi:hypothetical protein